MNIIGHLTLLGIFCTAVMASAQTIDKILDGNAKGQLFSHIKRHNFVFIKNRNFLLDLLKNIFRSQERQVKIRGRERTIVLPALKRFAIIHFVFVTVAAWVFVPGNEPLIHEIHPKAERSGWIIGEYQVHTMIFIEWLSLYISTLILSFPLDYISASKTLTLAHWASAKRKWIRITIVLVDIAITLVLVSLSLLMLIILVFVFSIDLPEAIYQALGGVRVWLSHEDLILPRLSHAAIVMASITALVILMVFSMHIASMIWSILDKLRVFRFFAVQYLKLETLPFTIAGFTLCSILVPLYIGYAIVF